MEKEAFHNKAHIQEARLQHAAKIKQATEIIDSTEMSWKEREKEYKRLAGIKFQYFHKTKKQQELERSLMAVKAVLPEETPSNIV